MGSFWTIAALAVAFASATLARAEGLPAALTPPLPMAALPSPILPDDTLTPAHLPMPARIVPRDESAVARAVALQAHISGFGTACDATLTVTAAPEAMLDVAISAPCLPMSRVEVSHAGLAFTASLPLTGEASFLLPALSREAVVTVTFGNSATLSASAFVPKVDTYARVALQWSGADPGALTAKAPRGLGGEMVRLGSSDGADDKVLEVFSRQTGDMTTGVVRLGLRAQVTENNCAAGLAARVHRIEPGQPATAFDLTLKGPGCGAIGQSLQLNNVLPDLKLAQI